MFVSSQRNMSGSLGEREVLWEHDPRGKSFRSQILWGKKYAAVKILVNEEIFFLQYKK